MAAGRRGLGAQGCRTRPVRLDAGLRAFGSFQAASGRALPWRKHGKRLSADPQEKFFIFGGGFEFDKCFRFSVPIFPIFVRNMLYNIKNNLHGCKLVLTFAHVILNTIFLP